MPRKAESITRNQDLDKLASIIRTAIDKTGKTDSEIADKAHITRSHLSYVLKGVKSLSEEKIKNLSEVLNLSESELLQAAGYIESNSVIDDVLSSIKKTDSITVLTDPHFLDSALFLWIFNSQFLNSFGIEWDIKVVSWNRVPIQVDRTLKSIGFYNRKARLVHGDKVIVNPYYWADLCVYKGYALIVRKEDAPELQKNPGIIEAKKYLQQLTTNKKPLIVTMASGTVKQLDTPFTKDVIWDDFDIEQFGNPDEALELFLKGYGDLFIGGLPQGYKAQTDNRCLTLMNIKNNPWLFSVNSLICSEEMFKEEKAIMSLITSVWFEVCNQLRKDRTFRDEMFKELNLMLKNRFNISEHSITPELIEEVFGNPQNSYEFFPQRPSGIVSQIMRILAQCVTQSIKYKKRLHISDEELAEAIKWVLENKIDPEIVTDLQ